MIYGYARVSTNHQDTELQRLALKAAGCDHIVEEHASGRKSNRPVLKRLIAAMQAGDELVVWKLDRIGRNVLHALLMFQQLQEKGINFRSITDGVDLKTASGRYNFRNILSAAQYESDLNSERTLAGLAVAREKGRVGGRRPKFTDDQWKEIGELIAAGESRQIIASRYNVGMSTLYKKFPAGCSIVAVGRDFTPRPTAVGQVFMPWRWRKYRGNHSFSNKPELCFFKHILNHTANLLLLMLAGVSIDGG